MNFLAHAYLSFNHPEVLVGNMISDFVKGNTRFQYAEAIQQGITLHRRIDCFTDGHEATKDMKAVFKPFYRLYSGPITDILYDHFLANDTAIFSEDTLLKFSQQVYKTLEDHTTQLPQRFTMVLPYMATENWLFNYKYYEGIEKSLRGLIRRSSFLSGSETAFRLFNENYLQLQQQYQAFFPDVKNYAKKELEQLVA